MHLHINVAVLSGCNSSEGKVIWILPLPLDLCKTSLHHRASQEGYCFLKSHQGHRIHASWLIICKCEGDTYKPVYFGAFLQTLFYFYDITWFNQTVQTIEYKTDNPAFRKGGLTAFFTHDTPNNFEPISSSLWACVKTAYTARPVLMQGYIPPTL